MLGIALPLVIAQQDARKMDNPFLHSVDENGLVRLELRELTEHPHFWWPNTLLNYQVAIGGTTSPPSEWTLIDELTGESVPLQVSDIRKKDGQTVAATVSFFSDLPTGGVRRFLLNTRGSNKPLHPAHAMKIQEEKQFWILDSGRLQVRLPKSRKFQPGETVPGPIVALHDGDGWGGDSRLISPRKAVRTLETTVLDRGPLFVRVRMDYGFDGGAHYTATVQLALDNDFISLEERFAGLDVADEAVFAFDWTGREFTHRRGDEGIETPRRLYFRGEDPFFTGPDRIEDPSREFYYRLGHVAADNTTHATATDFSDAKTGRAVGIAVLDGSRWDDGEYCIWASNDTLSVRFNFNKGLLSWRLPLAGRSRSLIIAAYNSRIAGQNLGEAFKRWRGVASAASVANRGVGADKSWISFLNSRQGGFSLDVVKDWHLEDKDRTPQGEPQSFPVKENVPELASLDAYLKALWADNELLRVEANWFSPVSLRMMSKWVIPGYYRFQSQMTPEQRRRASALILLHTYLASREELSPMLHVLKGHPNFMTDWKYPLLAGAFLFPSHPLASEWADQYEKMIQLMSVFHVRPDVKAWEARGGRWTENIGIYNWAFLAPAMQANQLGHAFDGRERMANPGLALHAAYLSGIVSAPVKLGQDGAPFAFTPGIELTTANGFQRIHPPQGAHSARRHIPGAAEELGEALLRYAPLEAEHLFWIAQRPSGGPSDFEGNPSGLGRTEVNKGTNPRLRSAKYTGYGFVFRAAVDTPEEIAVFLQQIDKGPNYRWGFGNEGGGGDVYYYAGGNSFAGHLGEDAGDRRVTDAELTSNTGVYKDYAFRGIGMNDLTEPLYDLESAQFAEILARPGPDAYSWPEYESRSVLLMGNDYIITFDTVNNPSRISWNTVKGQDKMPFILPIRGEQAFRTTQTSIANRFGTSESIRIEPYKGAGDRMTLVSHRDDFTAKNSSDLDTAAITEIRSPRGIDTIFQMRSPFRSEKKGQVFAGRVGVIRAWKDGRTELALFKGESIGTKQLQIEIDNPDLGVSAAFTNPEESTGHFFSRTGGNLTLTLEKPVTSQFYVNGQPVKSRVNGNSLTVHLPSGGGRWQLTAGPVEPMPPEITTSVARSDGVQLFFPSVPSACSYRIERSDDTGLTWTTIGESQDTAFVVTGVAPGTKFHARVIAINGTTSSRPSKDYPVYVTGKPLEPPVGLSLVLGPERVEATWGSVLGAREYVLYRRALGQTTWHEVYRGPNPTHIDHAPGVQSSNRFPGTEAAAKLYPEKAKVIYEYAVTAVDDVGESIHSSLADTNPASWRNWYPDTPLVFKRRTAYWLPPYVTPEQVPPESYPE